MEREYNAYMLQNVTLLVDNVDGIANDFISQTIKTNIKVVHRYCIVMLVMKLSL